MEFKDVERARKAYQAKLKKGWKIAGVVILVMVGIGAAVVGFSNFSFGGLDMAFGSSAMGVSVALFAIMSLLFWLAVSAAVIFFVTRKDAEGYRRTYKAYFVERNLRAVFSDLHYNHDAGLSESLLKVTGMVNTGDRYHSNDLTTGRYKDVGFTQADVHIETEHTDSDGDTTYTTIFRGRFMVFEFPKRFSFRLQVLGRKFHAYLTPRKGISGRKFVKIQTESTEFNQHFRVIAEDGFEAYYLLDPAMIERIQAMGERYKDGLLLGFVDNQLVVGVDDGKDSFEPPALGVPIDEKAETEKVASDIRVITDFVDQLKLDRKMFVN